MIKTTVKGILSIVILVILSCSTDHKSAAITEKQLHGHVKKVVEKHYFAKSEFGEIKKGHLLLCQRTSEYDKNRDIIKETCLIKAGRAFNDADEVDKTVNDIIRSNYQFECDCDEQTYIYKYDSKRTLIGKNIYAPDGSLETKYTYKYNDDKVLIEECQYLKRWDVQTDYTDFIEFKTTYEYDKNSNQIRKFTSDPFGSKTLEQTITHDTKGNLIEDCEFDRTGNPTFKTVYRYDDNNNLIKESFFIKDRPTGSIEFSYIYDNGHLKEKKRINNDSSVNKYTYSYDNLGNLIEVNSYSGAHLMEKFTEKYEKFDENENWIIRIKFQNEVPKRIVEREIEYY